jgi:O-antigen/teichoic acid export membrane protein
MILRIKHSRLVDYIKDPLHSNSIFLIASNATNALFGFFFWTMTARIYSPGDVGLATALVSAANMLAMFSGLGFGVGIIRFLPDENEKSSLINTAFTSTSIFSGVLALIFISGLNVWSPALAILTQSIAIALIFILLVTTSNLFSIQNYVFIAFRNTKFALVQSLIAGLRLAILPIFTVVGAIWIFSSFTVGHLIGFAIANIFIWKLCYRYRPFPMLDMQVFGKVIKFSFVNYIGDSLKLLPGFILPVIIVNIINPAMSAYFFVAWMIAGLLFAVAYSVNSTLLAEGSSGQDGIHGRVKKAAKFIFALLIPAIILILFFSGPILSMFGPLYAMEASHLLQLLALSSIPMAIDELYISVKRFEKKLLPVILVYGFIACGTISGSLLLLGPLGLLGIGIAWLVSNIITMLIILSIILWREGQTSPNGNY